MATLFLSNAMGCALIILIAAVKRVHHRRRQGTEVFQHLKPWGISDEDECYGNLPGFSAQAKN